MNINLSNVCEVLNQVYDNYILRWPCRFNARTVLSEHPEEVCEATNYGRYDRVALLRSRKKPPTVQYVIEGVIVVDRSSNEFYIPFGESSTNLDLQNHLARYYVLSTSSLRKKYASIFQSINSMIPIVELCHRFHAAELKILVVRTEDLTVSTKIEFVPNND